MAETPHHSRIFSRLRAVDAPIVLVMLLLVLVVGYTVAALCVGPSLYPDPSYGLLVRKSMTAGSPWNHMTEPKTDNIAEDRSYFYAVWSPGQYIVPGAIVDLGMTLGAALKVTCILCSLIGLIGWTILYRKLQFEWETTLLSVALIASTRSVNLSFFIYMGSDLLAFSSFPYIALLVLTIRSSYMSLVVCMPLMLYAFLMKNSLAIYTGAWIASVMAISTIWNKYSLRSTAMFVITILILIISITIINYQYTSRGWNPMSYTPSLSTNLASYFLPCVMPVLAGTSIDDLLSRVLMHPDHPKYNYKESFVIVFSLFVLGAAWIRNIYCTSSNCESLLQVAFFVAGVTAVFVLLLTTRSAASLDESRHYRLPGYAILPFFVQSILSTRHRSVQFVLTAILILPCIYGIASFASNWSRQYSHRDSHSAELKIVHLSLSPRDVTVMRRIDSNLPSGNNLVATSTPSVALEFQRARTLATSSVSDTVGFIEANPRSGVVDNLIVIVEARGMNEEKIRAWLASFRSYDSERWEFVEVDRIRIYVLIDQQVNRSWLVALLEERGR